MCLGVALRQQGRLLLGRRRLEEAPAVDDLDGLVPTDLGSGLERKTCWLWLKERLASLLPSRQRAALYDRPKTAKFRSFFCTPPSETAAKSNRGARLYTTALQCPTACAGSLFGC